jgi:hypothetical protein
MVIESCSPAMLWSADSAYLAVPQWTAQRKQKLLVIDVARTARAGLKPARPRA